ncbi:MAG TPA: tetraacyldisaccharide 4'-kinase [Steroidobacteraceae bacterium]|nr:tetraacyldisaccharide 4'-kinase [Steroidobacteraceae bacterium]
MLYDWLQRVWYANAISGVVLRPLGWLFGALVHVRSALYRKGWLGSVAVARPVIVVGNLTTGGTGKTPLVLWLAEQLRAKGLRPGIVLRGYGGSARTPRRVDAGAAAIDVGDEAALLAARSRCPVAVGADRVAAARLLEAEVDVILADDGLQHLRLKRDLEIVVIDGVRRFGNRRLLPAGPLREPLSRLESVDAAVVNGGTNGVGGLKMSLAGDHAVALIGGERRALTAFAPGPVHAVAAIGNPERFFTMLREHGLNLVPHPLPDHHAYARTDLEFGDSLPILMTQKDAVKCARFAERRQWYVPVDAVFSDEDAQQLLNMVLDAVAKSDVVSPR